MPQFKAVYIFSQGKRGWTETWYFTATDIGVATGSAQAVSAPLIAPRADDTVLESIRITQSDIPPNRISRLLTVNIAGSRTGPAMTGSPQEGPDIPNSCAFMTARFNDGSKRTVLLRGLNDQDVVRDQFTGQPAPSPGLTSALLALGVSLQGNGASIRRFQRPAVGSQIGLVQPDPVHTTETQFTYTAVLGVPIPSGTMVRFTGVPRRDLPWLKGQWPITRSVIGGFNLSFAIPSGVLLAPPKMFAYPVVYTYSPLAAFAAGQPTFQFRDWRTRDTGRPIGAPRGRSPGLRFRR